MAPDPRVLSDAELEAARGAIERARALLAASDLLNAEEILQTARSAMATLEEAERIAGAGETRSPPGSGARGRILSYFLSRDLEVPVTGPELRRIAGIQEWARRVRELRVEAGWDIRYDGHAYRLMADQPNEEVAEAWRLAKIIRETALDPRDRILRYLQARVGQVVRGELLLYVAGTQEHGRQISELRAALGYAISTFIDRPDLKRDEYVLESPEPALDETERAASETLRKTVFERDGYRCGICGRRYGTDVGVVLTVYQLVPLPDGASDTDPENFVALCRRDREAVTEEQRQELLKRRRRRIEDTPSC